MPPRILAFIFLTAVLAFGSPVSAKEKKTAAKASVRTWKTVVDYVLANGVDRTLKAPLSRKLGFDSDAVATKALRYKNDDTPDKKTHAVYVLYTQDKDGKQIPKEFVLGNGIVVVKDGIKSVEDLFIRADLSGKIITAITSKGPSGQIEEIVLAVDSPAAIAGFKAEQSVHLNTMDLKKLSKK
jgi:hypothetical protein